MKLLIAGSRKIETFDLSPHIPPETKLIIAGGARGIDTLAERYADENQISKLILRPQYSRYGKAAPLKRNEQMIDLADAILVVWDGKSKGSHHTITHAKKSHKRLTVIIYSEELTEDSGR